MHIVILKERGVRNSSFIREMKAYNFQLPIIWKHPNVSCISKNYFEQVVSFEIKFLWFSMVASVLQLLEFYDAISVLPENTYDG